MIREFADEITRLRQQLSAFSGGKIDFSGVALGEAQGAGTVTNVERKQVTYVENKEKMRAMEAQIETEKKEIRKRFEKSKAKVMAQTELAQEEQKKLIDDLNAKEKAKQEEKAAAKKALKRLNKMQEKMLRGDEAMEQALKQEKKLAKQQVEIEAKKKH